MTLWVIQVFLFGILKSHLFQISLHYIFRNPEIYIYNFFIIIDRYCIYIYINFIILTWGLKKYIYKKNTGYPADTQYPAKKEISNHGISIFWDIFAMYKINTDRNVY